MMDTGLMLSAARSFTRSHAARGNEKGVAYIPKPRRRDACATSGVTCYDTLGGRGGEAASTVGSSSFTGKGMGVSGISYRKNRSSHL